MRPAGDADDVDRLRGQLGVLLARALRAPWRRHRHRRPGPRLRGACGRRRNRPLGHVPAQAGRDAFRSRRRRAHREARRRALRLRSRGFGLLDPSHRAERALGIVSSDAAHTERRALSRQRPPLREPAQRARRPAGAPRLERAVHGRRRRGVVEVHRSGVRSRVGEVREREPHLARRCRRRIASASGSLSRVRCEATRGRHPAVADRAHDRVPDRAWHRRARGAAAAFALVRRHEVAGAGRT